MKDCSGNLGEGVLRGEWFHFTDGRLEWLKQQSGVQSGLCSGSHHSLWYEESHGGEVVSEKQLEQRVRTGVSSLPRMWPTPVPSWHSMVP